MKSAELARHAKNVINTLTQLDMDTNSQVAILGLAFSIVVTDLTPTKIAAARQTMDSALHRALLAALLKGK